MIYNKDYFCEVKEEIIVYNKEKHKITGLLTIVEYAKTDLRKLTEIWQSLDW